MASSILLLVLCASALQEGAGIGVNAHSGSGVNAHFGQCLLQHQKKFVSRTRKNVEDPSTSLQQNLAVKHLQSIKCSHDEDDKLSLASFNASLLDRSYIRELDDALALGAKFLMDRQKPEGNFHYEYNWQKHHNLDEDNSVRQAGTTWGLAFLYASVPTPKLSEAVLKALNFFERISSVSKNGCRFVRYPGEKKGKLGTIALLALAHIDFLRSKPPLTEDQRGKLTHNLDGYIKMLLHAESTQHHQHSFHGKYTQDGEPVGKDSAYYDGEVLLALIRAARHMNRTDLWETIPRVAKGSWKLNAAKWIKERDLDELSEDSSKRMKGFYQWSSMAMYELKMTRDNEFDPFGKYVLQYADWRLDTAKDKYPHQGKRHNIAVTLEGLVPAYLVALHTKDDHISSKIGCFLRKSIMNLHTKQVGHPQAAGLASQAPSNDHHAHGGVQPSLDSPKLRIDTTQHQMHAVLQIKQLLTNAHDDPLIF